MPSSSSSSSEDEDLSLFASCAVSADQIQQDASIAVKKAAQKNAARRAAAAAAALGGGVGVASTTPRHTKHGDVDNSTDGGPPAAELDLVSAKIASALDAILARQLDPPAAGSSKPDQHPAGAAAASSSPKRKQQSAAAATEAGAGDTGDAGADADDDATGVQLFRAVPKGTPCVILQDSCGLEGAWEQHTQQHQHTNSSAALQPMQRPPPLRDVIPRLSLAERSKAAGKRKFERVLSELAVDGAALMSAAAAAGYGGVLKAGSSPSPAAATGGSGVDGGSSKPAVGGSKAAGGGKGAAAASTTAAWVKGFKRVKGGQKVQGVVVDAKEWVSHDVRVAKLLGTQVGPACR